jgi:ATP-dependent DNA ligase
MTQTKTKSFIMFVEPMLCAPVKNLPQGPAWEYELKLDGYRALGLKSGGRARLFSRNGKDFSARFASVTRALDALPDETLIDGEVVAVDERGRPSFSDLQNFNRAPVYYAFDLPTLSGEDLMKRSLDERRKLLRKTVRQLAEPIRFSETFDTSPGDLVAVVREQGLEGVVAKRRDSLYEPGKRSGAWVKLRVNRRQNFVIGGYAPPRYEFRFSSGTMTAEISNTPGVSARVLRQHRGERFSPDSQSWKSQGAHFQIYRMYRKGDGAQELLPTRWRRASGSSLASWSQ